jgi:hypothetical protein
MGTETGWTSRLLDVRRLAAVDMYGTAGTSRRRRIITAEYLLGAIMCPAVGISVLHARPAPATAILGIWLVGVGVNYIPLALHAVSLLRQGTLDTEVAGTDMRLELRRYGVKQLWIAVPFLLAILAIAQR